MTDFLSTPLGRRAALRRLSLVLGGAVTAPLASGLLSGCRTPESGALADYSYQTLNADQQRTVAALVDQIIPPTETAGAADAGVPQFIDKMLSEWYAPEEREEFLSGIARVDGRAEGGSFADLDSDAQARLVAALDAEAYASTGPDPIDQDVVEAGREGTAQERDEQQNEVAGMQGPLGEAQSDSSGAVQVNTGEGTATVGGGDALPFFRQLKELTLAGYYTSEVGATEELQWLAAPGRWEADVPLSEIGRAWA